MEKTQFSHQNIGYQISLENKGSRAPDTTENSQAGKNGVTAAVSVVRM